MLGWWCIQVVAVAEDGAADDAEGGDDDRENDDAAWDHRHPLGVGRDIPDTSA